MEPVSIAVEKKEGKKLYDYQQEALNKIFERLVERPKNYNLLYQLPTGGGKTVIFSKIAERYIKETGKKVLILTHRIELCHQTSNQLLDIGINNKIINSKVKELPDQDEFQCFVAMVETLNNRLSDKSFTLENVGLVVIDEAHYNSFRKMFKYFEDNVILGVTATPLSSNNKLPMKDVYDELIVGDSISALIEKGFLSKATTYSFNVSLRSLKVGITGDYTVSSSELLYSGVSMQNKLLHSYREQAEGTKTLIFNSGINTSQHVHELFSRAGYDIRHLDNTNSETERREILDWFKHKKDAILTSVSILTTGFDEPTVETVILNRATKSLTLYHQMIGRGSRVLPDKSTFSVIDLGNNASRFGLWEAPINWQHIFKSPDFYYDNLTSDEEIERHFKYVMPQEIRARFANSEDIEFDVTKTYQAIADAGMKPVETINRSIEQHAKIIHENAPDVWDALELSRLLHDEIEYRVRQYTYCISKCTENFIKWLQEDYKAKLEKSLKKKYWN